jgi:5'-nucleotidase (lipoprotein e(P4) family)
MTKKRYLRRMKKIWFGGLGLLFSTLSFAQVDSVQSVNNKLLPVLWQQHAAEYRALCYQAFNLASERLEKVKKKHRGLPYAIITDIDETVLDNSRHEAQLIVNHDQYNYRSWKRWTDLSQATAVPGAVEFLKSASAKGISIFYVSNRDSSEIQSSLINLKKLNFPDADSAHVLFKKKTSSKEERRLQVTKNYNVIMLLGDNLNDFLQVFEKKSSIDRMSEVDKLQTEWGKRFIVLPNSVYGEWENALLEYQRNLTPVKKEKMLRNKLILIAP